VTASEPSTCEACDKFLQDGHVDSIGRQWTWVEQVYYAKEHHALIRALAEERDGLRAALQALDGEGKP
jgi:hypothetical protein